MDWVRLPCNIIGFGEIGKAMREGRRVAVRLGRMIWYKALKRQLHCSGAHNLDAADYIC